MPNAKGGFNWMYGHGSTTFSGAFYGDNRENSSSRGSYAGLFIGGIDLSRSNNIYKDGLNNVLTDRYAIEYWIKYKNS